MSRAFVEHGQEPRLLFAFLRRTFHRRAVRAYSGRSRVTQIHCFQWLMESGFPLRLWRSAVIKASFLFLDTWRPFRAAQDVVEVEEKRGWITRESALCRMSARWRSSHSWQSPDPGSTFAWHVQIKTAATTVTSEIAPRNQYGSLFEGATSLWYPSKCT